ncbi:MAG TPA: hypothetical protein H9860_04815 [Candidatus Gemmiger faecavium]|nr:hypothetical protein [Candidatus Gemmiger faecavium]
MDRDGGNIQEKQPRTGHTILPSAIKIVVKRCQDKKLCPQGSVAKGTFQQDRACDKQNIAQKRDEKAAGKQASQQGTERTLQEKAKQGKQSEILESIRKDRGKKAEESGKQRDRVGVSDAEPIRIIEVLCDTERETQVALPVKKPARIVLLDVFFNVSATAKSIVGKVQRRNAVNKQKSQYAEQTACKKE